MRDQMGSDLGANPGEADRQGRRAWSWPVVADEDVSRTAAKFNGATESPTGVTTPVGPS